MLSLALDSGRSGFRPTVIRVRITKSAIARNDQRDTLFQRPHAAIVPDVPPDVFYRVPGTLVGSARADVEQNGRCVPLSRFRASKLRDGTLSAALMSSLGHGSGLIYWKAALIGGQISLY